MAESFRFKGSDKKTERLFIMMSSLSLEKIESIKV